MFPYDWSSGENNEPTFGKFQTFSDEAKEIAAMRFRSRSYNEIFDEIQRSRLAANDNSSPVGDEVCVLLLCKTYMSMVACWLCCDRDMVRTKLSWTPENASFWTLG